MFILKKETKKSYAGRFQRIVYLEIVKQQPRFDTRRLCPGLLVVRGWLQSWSGRTWEFTAACAAVASPLLQEGQELSDTSPATHSKALFDRRLPQVKGRGWLWKRWMKALGRTNWLVLAGQGQQSWEHLIANSLRDKNKSGFHQVLLLRALCFL